VVGLALATELVREEGNVHMMVVGSEQSGSYPGNPENKRGIGSTSGGQGAQMNRGSTTQALGVGD